MKVAQICISLLIGFLLGAWLGHPRSVKAASGVGLYVKKVSEGYNPDPSLATKTIVGFSCTPARSGELTECYVAAQ